jgi:hypothetical protein
MVSKLLQCLGAAGRFSDEEHVWLAVDDRAKSLAKKWMVIDDQDANFALLEH